MLAARASGGGFKVAAAGARSPGMVLYTAEAVESSLIMASAALQLKNTHISSLQDRVAELEARTQFVQLSVTTSQPAEVVKLSLNVTDAAVGGDGAPVAASKGRAAEAVQQLEATSSREQLETEFEMTREQLEQREAELADLQGGVAGEDTAAEHVQQGKAEAADATQRLVAQLQEARARLAQSQRHVLELQAGIAARDEAILVEAGRSAAEIAELKAAIVARDTAVAMEAERAAAESAKLKAALAARDETIAELQQSTAEAEGRAAQLSPQLCLGDMKLRAAEAQLQEAQGALAESREETERLRARVVAREEVILQLEGAKAEMEAAMEVRQAEQMQLLDTLQQYLGMCDAVGGASPVASPELLQRQRHQQEDSVLGILGPEGSPSAERVKRLEERLEFWQQRLESAAKLRSRHSSPEGAEGEGQAGDGAGEEGTQLESAFAAAASAAAAPRRPQQGGVGQALLSALLSSATFAPPGAVGGAMEQTPAKAAGGRGGAVEEGEGEDGPSSKAVTPPRPIPNALQSPLASHPIALSPSGSMYSGLGSSVSTPVSSVSGSVLRGGSLLRPLPEVSEGAGTAGVAGGKSSEQKAMDPGSRASFIPQRPSNLGHSGPSASAAEAEEVTANPPSSTLYRPAARTQGLPSPTKPLRAVPSPSSSEGNLQGLESGIQGPPARRSVLTASGRGGAAGAGRRPVPHVLAMSASRIPKPGGSPMPQQEPGEDHDNQGAFASELLERLSIGSPKKVAGAGGSRVSFKE